MKRKINLIIVLLMISYCSSKAQIVLDTTIQTPLLIGYDFYPVQISNTETKYYLADTVTNTFSLYNIDFTPFLLNISVPEPFSLFTKQYEVIYLSRTLFDCDSTTIEYAYAAQAGPLNRKFYIMRTDGTELFSLDSTIAPYSFGILNGSQITTPIVNTSSGTKLFLYYPINSNNLRIYSLCGTLPMGINIFNTDHLNSFVKIFPNPSNGNISFEFNLPDNFNEYQLIIFNSNSQEMKRETINSFNNNIKLDVSNFNSGNYFYSILSKNSVVHSGKFIIEK